WKTLRYAIEEIEKDTSLSKVKINIVGHVGRDNTIIQLSKKITKDYIITSEYPIGSIEPVNDWEVYQGNVYKGSCNYDVSGVYRIDEKTSFNKSLELKKVNSLSECEKNYNTFFSNGENVYVHKSGTESINTRVLINVQAFQIELSGGKNQKFNLKDIEILDGSLAQSCYIITDKG